MQAYIRETLARRRRLARLGRLRSYHQPPSTYPYPVKKTSAALVLCECEASWPVCSAEEIIYLPKGSHVIRPKVDGIPKRVEVHVDETAVAILQRALEQRLGERGRRPFLAFNHKNESASAWAKRFKWDPERGIMLELDWSGAGKAALEQKNYSYFSPTFLLDPEGRPAGLPSSGECGSLCNNPAFQFDPITAEEGEPELGLVGKMLELRFAYPGLGTMQALAIAQAELAAGL